MYGAVPLRRIVPCRRGQLSVAGHPGTIAQQGAPLGRRRNASCRIVSSYPTEPAGATFRQPSSWHHCPLWSPLWPATEYVVSYRIVVAHSTVTLGYSSYVLTGRGGSSATGNPAGPAGPDGGRRRLSVNRKLILFNRNRSPVPLGREEAAEASQKNQIASREIQYFASRIPVPQP